MNCIVGAMRSGSSAWCLTAAEAAGSNDGLTNVLKALPGRQLHAITSKTLKSDSLRLSRREGGYAEVLVCRHLFVGLVGADDPHHVEVHEVFSHQQFNQALELAESVAAVYTPPGQAVLDGELSATRFGVRG